MNAARVVIQGRVQGVGYRAWTVRTASKLGLKGWVRNISDGTVEAVFHGDDGTIEQMLEACKDGPIMARVSRIERFEWDETVSDEHFIMKKTTTK